MKVRLSLFSSVSHTPPTALQNPLTSMMITAAESFSKRGWVRKLRLILSDNNSRAMFSESMVVLTRTVLP